MNKKLLDINAIRTDLRPHLHSYLTSQGVDFTAAGKFKCFVHDDTNPSAHLHANGQMWKCFGCGESGDILDASAILEGRPQTGPGWLKGTLVPLAQAFGIPVGDTELTEAEQKEFEIYRAHAQATRLLLTMTKSQLVTDKIASYKWSEKTLRTFGVGGVSSTAEYLKKMESAGYARPFLHEIGLDDTRIFNSQCLVYSVKDEHGETVGFSARNLTYDAALEEAKAAAEEHGADSKQAKNLREAIPAKYVNSIQTDKDGKPAQRKSITFNPFLKSKLIGVLGSSFLRAGESTVDGKKVGDFHPEQES